MDQINFKLSKFGMNNISTTTASVAQAAQLWASTTTESENDFQDLPKSADGEFTRFSRSLLNFAAVMTIIIMIVGICGNLLTIVALLKCPKVRNVAAAFIISLCVADCIFCTIVLPFNAFRFIQGTWTHGDILCRVIPFIQYGNIGVSLLCIAMITINRYIMIAHHSAYPRIYKRHWIGCMIAFCWIFSYGMQLPTFFKVWGAFGYDSNLGTCSILKDSNGRSSKTVLFVIAFLIPCIIIIGCYARIFWVVHKSELRLRRHTTKQNSIPNNMRPPPSAAASRVSSPVSSSSFDGSTAAEKYSNNTQKSIRIKDQRDVKAKRNEWRITKMVLAIFLSFVMCYLPITVIKIADKDVNLPGFHIFGYIMLYLSSCINPIIYVIMNKQYRQAYKTVLLCKPVRLLPFTNGGSSLGEMERHRIQLQPQSYHGITSFHSRLQQPAPASYGGTYKRQPSSELVAGYRFKSYDKSQPYYQQQQQQQQYHHKQYNHQQQQQQQQQPHYEPYTPPASLMPIGITATIFPTPRFSASKYSSYIGGGRGRRSCGGSGRDERDKSRSRSPPGERHSR